MKNIGTVTFLALVLAISAGCQQERQKQTSSVSRKDRLVGYENLGLKDALAKCREEIENQKSQLQKSQEQCQKEEQKSEETISWLLKDLPADLLKQVEDLTKENEELTKKKKVNSE